MRHARLFGFTGLTLAVVGALAFAQSEVTALPDNVPVASAPLEIDLTKTTWGDAEAGKAKAGECAACHGMDGNSVNPMYPSIAGQSERYSARQIALIATGQRSTPLTGVMLPFVQNLTAQDMRDLGAYFATQKANAGLADDAEVTEGPYAGMKFYEVGQALYRAGDPARGLPACMACHGPTGGGNPGPAYPHLGGQHADYTVTRLQDFKTGQTNEHDPRLFKIMAKIAAPLTDQEIMALASYIQGLHNRADDVPVAAAP